MRTKRIRVPDDKDVFDFIQEKIKENPEQSWVFIHESVIAKIKTNLGRYSRNNFEQKMYLSYGNNSMTIEHSYSNIWHRVISLRNKAFLFQNVKEPEDIWFFTAE